MTKAELRRRLLKERDALSPDTRRELDRRIGGHLGGLKEYREARTVLFFVSFRSEVDTHSLIASALVEGKTVAVPRVQGRAELDLHVIGGLHDLEAGSMGILEPRPTAKRIRSGEVDLIVVPGAGFDRRGNRIGYGGGYYDRLLRETPRRILRLAVAYGIQLVGEVPAEAHDERMDVIVTEDGPVRCH